MNKNNEAAVLQAILADLAALGGRLEVESGVLRCHVPAGVLPQALADAIRARKDALLRFLDIPRSGEKLTAPRVGDSRTEGRLSSAQERIWFWEQYQPGSAFYLMPLALLWRGKLQRDGLSCAWQAMVDRHPALRTRLVEREGLEAIQLIEPGLCTAVTFDDWSDVGGVGGSPLLLERLRLEASQPFDLRSAPLARLNVYSLNESVHVLLLCMHHIVSDGWSVGVLTSELLRAYDAAVEEIPSRFKPLPLQYLDYCDWQKAYLESSAHQSDLAYWVEHLRGAPSRSYLPGYSSIQEEGVEQGGRQRIALPTQLHQSVEVWARTNGGTLYSVLLAALYAAMHLWSGEQDLVVGGVVAGREHPDLEGVVGCFMNSLPLRCIVAPDSGFRALHAQVHQQLLSAWEHRDCPFEKIVEAVNPVRANGGTPLFNVGFLLQNYPVSESEREARQIEVIPIDLGGRSLDLRWIAGHLNGEFVVACESSVASFSSETIQLMLKRYVALLAHATACPEQALVEYRSQRDLLWPRPARRVVVGGTFTVEPVLESLAFWVQSLPLAASVRFASYGQLIQSMLDPKSLMRRHCDHAVVLLRLEDWLFVEREPNQEALRRWTQIFVDACNRFREAEATRLSVWICPPSERAKSDPSVSAILAGGQDTLVQALSPLSDVRVTTSEAMMEKYELTEIDDPYLEETGHIPYVPTAYTAFGTLIARDLAAHERPPLKAVVLDADNTLWRGICGEDGVDGVVVDESSLSLQRFFLQLREQGVALCLCSKNVEADVRSVFDGCPDMLLAWTDISAYRVNWQRKSENLREIAKELNIALDTMAFVDDNPTEIAEVEAHCPDILAVLLPSERENMLDFLHGIWEFDVVQRSAEGALRLSSYRENTLREALRGQCDDIDAYLHELQISVELRELRSEDLQRAAELIQRTNQFNTTTIRRSAAELEKLWRDGSFKVSVVNVKDRFGDYGTTGLLLYSATSNYLVVDTWLLSCRVLGKRVEHRILDKLVDEARRLGCSGIEVPFVATDRNQPAADFLQQVLHARPGSGNTKTVVYTRALSL